MKVWHLLLIVLALVAAIVYAFAIRDVFSSIEQYSAVVEPGVIATYKNVPNPIQGSSPKLQGR